MLVAVVGCDTLEPRGDFDAAIYQEMAAPERAAERAAAVERTPSAVRVTADQIEACHDAHRRARAERPPPAPDQVAPCTGPDDCVAQLVLGAPVGVEPEPPPVPRRNLHLEVALDDSLFPWQRGGSPSATVTVRDVDTGALALQQPVEASAPLVSNLLLDSDRRWTVVVDLDQVACHGGVAGQAVLASDIVLDQDTSLELTLDASAAVTVAGTLALDDAVPERAWLDRSVWALRLRRADVVADESGVREVWVGTTGAFELEVFPGAYDVYVERIDEIAGERLECRDRSGFEHASLGQWRVAEDVVIEPGKTLDLVLRPIAVDVEIVPDAHLPEGWSRTVDIDFDPAPRSGGARRRLQGVDADIAHRVWLWPGTYEVAWDVPDSDSPAWARSLEVELDTSRRLDLGLGAHRLELESDLDDPARPGWLRELTLIAQGGGRRLDGSPGDPIYLASGTYTFDLGWGYDGLYTGRMHDLVEDLVVEGDRVVRLDDLPLEARARLAWVAPEPEPDLVEMLEPDDDDDDDDDEPFSQDPPERDAAVLLVDPVDGRTQHLTVARRQWRDATLATAHLFAGVYDVLSADAAAQRWPLAACVAFDGGEPARVPWQVRTRPVVLDIVGLDTRKPLELEFRLLDSAAIPGHRWETPRTHLIGSYVEPVTLHLVPGTWEITGFQDWGGGELEPVVLEVR